MESSIGGIDIHKKFQSCAVLEKYKVYGTIPIYVI